MRRARRVWPEVLNLMHSFDEPGLGDRQRLEDVIARFEDDWHSGRLPQLEEFLYESNASVPRGVLLRELVHADLELRIKAGEPVRIEVYIARYPELGEHQEALSLLRAECRLRARIGSISQDEYLSRFPQFRREIIELFSEPQVARSAGLRETPSTGHGDLSPGSTRHYKRELPQHLPPTDARQDPYKTVADPHKAYVKAMAEAGAEVDLQKTSVPDGEHFDPDERPPLGTRANEALDPSRYEIEDEIAAGGMGRILRAVDHRVGRQVAFKELLPGGSSDPEMVQRFVTEAQVTGQLEHPSIVPIYDLSWHADGTPFYVMKLVRGRTFRVAIKAFHALPRQTTERAVAQRNLLSSFVNVCNAVAFAHDRGVLHRDLKPINIMLGDFGETVVLDWGLAKVLGKSAQAESLSPETISASDTILPDTPIDQGSGRSVVTAGQLHPGSETRVGRVMGSFGYMPPEQAEGRVDELDARSDVYSLGAILFELITNQPAIQGETLTLILTRTIKGEFPRPRTIDRNIPRALEAICLRAMSRLKSDRYATALLLARDVERYLANEPVLAYAEPWPLRTWRWVKRHRTAVSSCLAGIVMVGVVVLAWQAAERRELQRDQDAVEMLREQAAELIQQGRFLDARNRLTESSSRIRQKPALAPMAASVDDLSGLLDASVSAKARETAVAAVEARTRQELPEAARLLADAVNLVKPFEKLRDLDQRFQTELKEVNRLLDDVNTRKKEQEAYAQFSRHADAARFFATQLIHDSAPAQARKSQAAALAALSIYGLEIADAKPPAPKKLSQADAALISLQAIEMGLLLADAENILSRESNLDHRQAALQRGLAWLERTHRWATPSRAVWLLEAELARHAGQDDRAQRALRNAEGTPPATASEYFQLAEFERRNNQEFLKAAELYQQALDREPRYFLASYFLGVAQIQKFQSLPAESGAVDGRTLLAAAQVSFTACLAQRPSFPWPYIMRGIASGFSDQFDDADADFQQAASVEPQVENVYDPELYRYTLAMNRGIVRFRQKRFVEAADDFIAAGQLRPENADPLINLARTRSAQEKPEEAIGQLGRAVAMEPKRPEPHVELATIHLRMGQFSAAIDEFNLALACDPRPGLAATCQFEIGKIHDREMNWQPALAAYDAALKLDADNADIHRLRAEVLLRLDRDTEAVAAFSTYLSLVRSEDEPLNRALGDVYRARGLARDKTGDVAAAMNDYTRSLELQQEVPNILTTRGWKYILNWQELATRDFDRALAKNPLDGRSYAGRGYVRVMQGDWSSAVKDAEEAVRLGPKDDWQMRYFNPATIFSQAHASVLADQNQPETQRMQLATDFLRRSVELLKLAADMLPSSERGILVQAMQADSALDPIRGSIEFRTLLATLKSQ